MTHRHKAVKGHLRPSLKVKGGRGGWKNDIAVGTWNYFKSRGMSSYFKKCGELDGSGTGNFE